MINIGIILDTLQELSDAQYQDAIWNAKVPGRQSSYTEAVCALFDDSGLTREIDSGRLGQTYSRSLVQCAQELSRLVVLIPDTGAPREVLQHPKMNEVRALSAKLRIMLLVELKTMTEDV
jgi:hypothetical protein